MGDRLEELSDQVQEEEESRVDSSAEEEETGELAEDRDA